MGGEEEVEKAACSSPSWSVVLRPDKALVLREPPGLRAGPGCPSPGRTARGLLWVTLARSRAGGDPQEAGRSRPETGTLEDLFRGDRLGVLRARSSTRSTWKPRGC